MKRSMIGIFVMLVFQLCTSELNEINGVIGDHIDTNNSNSGTINSIPSDTFLGQYFSSKDGTNPISTRIENRIRHDFNSPLSNQFNKDELSAKWTGDFYFESGNYVFNINSDKDILLMIDDKVLLNQSEITEENTYHFEQELDGVHRIVVEYNLDNTTPVDPVDNTTPADPVDNTTPVDPVDNTTPVDPVDNTTPADPVDNTTPADPVDNTTPADPVDNTTPDDPVVEVDNGTPTVEVDWSISENVALDTLYNQLSNIINQAGEVVNLSEAVYIESGQVKIPGNKTIIGHGPKTIIKAASSFHHPVFTMEANYCLLRIMGSNVAIKDLMLDGDNKKCYGGIFSRYNSNITLQNLEIKNMYYTGIWIPDAGDELTIDHINLTNCSNGSTNFNSNSIGLGTAANATISNVLIKENIGYGIGMQNYGAYLTWDNVVFDKCDITVPDQGTWISSTGGTAAAFTFSLDNGSAGYDIKNSRITNCTLNNMISIVNKGERVRESNCILIDKNKIEIDPSWEPRTIVEMGENGITFKDNFVVNVWEVFGFYSSWEIKNPEITNNIIVLGHKNYSGWFRNMIGHYGSVVNARIEKNTIIIDANFDFDFIKCGKDVINPYISKNIVISNQNYSSDDKKYLNVSGSTTDVNIDDNIIYGAWNAQGFNQTNVSQIPINGSGAKPFPFYQSKQAGYGAIF